MESANQTSTDTQTRAQGTATSSPHEQTPLAERLMACPVCGHDMPDLKGGKDTICPQCGFKDSCCY